MPEKMIDQLYKQLEDKDDEVAELRQQLAKFIDNREAAYRLHEEKFDQLRLQLAELKKLIESLRQKLADMTEAYAKVTERVHMVGGYIDQLATKDKQVTLLRDAMEAAWQDGYGFCGAEGLTDAQKQFQAAFAATEPKRSCEK